jgi:FtsZ-binding cell division protein ZapB
MENSIKFCDKINKIVKDAKDAILIVQCEIAYLYNENEFNNDCA